MSFQKRLIRFISFFALGFTLLFLFRLLYGYSLKIDSSSQQGTYFSELPSIRNFASKSYKGNATSNSPSNALDQKYERIATIKTQSMKFKEEEELVRSTITDFEAIIQFENNTGNPGERNLHLLIGIAPEKFDDLHLALEKIGKVLSREISKKDMTNEFQELMAQRASLENMKRSLIGLKDRSGDLDEFIQLENRILDVERELQTLGVQLGSFDEENEFCTIRYTLMEGKEVSISFAHRVKVAIEWTAKIYLRIVVALFVVVLLSYFSILIIDRSKVLIQMTGNMKDQ